MSKVKNSIYQDTYNPVKTWQVCYMNNGFYLKQFINNVQFGSGLRCSKKYIESLGIFTFKQIKTV